jgi:hypothetical protein
MYFFFQAMRAQLKIPTDLWCVSQVGAATRLEAIDSVGSYVIPEGTSPDRIVEIAKLLSPPAIRDVLDPTMEKNKCSCGTGLGRARCQHSFTFNEVRALRAEYLCHRDGLTLLVEKLKCHPENNFHVPPPDSSDLVLETRRVFYFLNNRPVCRGFHDRVYALPKKKGDCVSALVRGLDPRVEERRKLPGYDADEGQVENGVLFLKDWLTGHAQTSGDGNMYWPVNLSLLYIYNNLYWPWWKDFTGDWKNDPRDPELHAVGLGAENELSMALTELPDDKLVLLYKAKKQKQRRAPRYLTQRLEWQNKVAVSEKDEEAKHNSVPADSVPFASDHYESDEKEHPPEDYYDMDLQEWMQQLAKEDAEAARQADQKDALDEDEANRLLRDLQREAGFPSYSSFVRARHHPTFRKLKRRPKHNHCRCPTCTELTSLLHMAARNKQARLDFDRMLKAHYFEVKQWRSLERELHAEAKLNPDSLIVLSEDGTSSFGFPHMTRRPIKSMPSDAVHMTPWNCTNHGTGEDIYMYDIKGKWKHGADYLCTNLYTILRRIKTKPEGPDMTDTERKQKRCKKLVLMGDNVSENKTQLCSSVNSWHEAGLLRSSICMVLLGIHTTATMPSITFIIRLREIFSALRRPSSLITTSTPGTTSASDLSQSS